MSEEGKKESMRMIGQILHRKNELIQQLREENARLRGELSEAQKRQNREDDEVIAIVHRKAEASEGCLHMVIQI